MLKLILRSVLGWRNGKIDFRDEVHEKGLEYDMAEKQRVDLHEILSTKWKAGLEYAAYIAHKFLAYFPCQYTGNLFSAVARSRARLHRLTYWSILIDNTWLWRRSKKARKTRSWMQPRALSNPPRNFKSSDEGAFTRFAWKFKHMLPV